VSPSRSRLAVGLVVAAVAVLVALAIAGASAGPAGLGGLLEHGVLGEAIMAVTTTAVGALVAAQRGRNVVGWLFLALGLAIALSAAAGGALDAALARHGEPGWAALVAWLRSWVWFPTPFLLAAPLLLFPDGRLPSPRWRPVLWLLIGAGLLGSLALALAPGSRAPGLPPSADLVVLTGAAGEAAAAAHAVLQPLAGVVLLAAVASLLVRLRRAEPLERQRLVLFIVPSATAVAVFAAAASAGHAKAAFPLTWPVVPVAAAVAIRRHGLLDVELFLSRAVTVALAVGLGSGVYVAAALGVGELVGRTAGHGAALVATATVLLAAQPLNRLVRRTANRVVYGVDVSPYDALAGGLRRVADAADPEQLLADLARLLCRATHADWVGVYVGTADRQALLCEHGTLADDAAVMATEVHDGQQRLGTIALRKHRRERLAEADERLLHAAAQQAALLLGNVHLSRSLAASLEEVQRSRERLATAADRERRRLERDLHDGVQQHLFCVKSHAARARQLLAGDQPEGDLALRAVLDSCDGAVAAVRAVSRGLLPPLLSERGVGAALRAALRTAPPHVTLSAVSPLRAGEAAESALYFAALEAVTNAVKHADARHVELTLQESAGQLVVEVRDDGRGLPPQVTSGTGLVGVRDRLEAVGGTAHWHSVTGEGTTVTLAVPLASSDDPTDQVMLPRQPAHGSSAQLAEVDQDCLHPPVHPGLVRQAELAEHRADVLLDGAL
jgi:signal transduction histidine kinase